MARVKYREHLAQVEAIQNKGNNNTELVEFDPEVVHVDEENKVWVTTPITEILVDVSEWIIDDPYIGYISVTTDAAFRARFDPTPMP